MTDAPAGWFPDTNQPGRQRWWDGTAWTDHYHDATQAAPPQPPASPQWQAAPPPATTASGSRPGPPLTISIVMIVLGLALAITGGVLAVVPFLRSISSDKTMPVPGQATFNLSSGDYLIYEATGTEGSDGGLTVSIAAEAVRITGPDGEVAVSQDTGATETITNGSQEYTGAVEFKITKTADYYFEILDGQPGRALVARSLSETLKRAVPWILVGALGGLVLLAGIVLVIVGSVRRHRWNASQNPMMPRA